MPVRDYAIPQSPLCRSLISRSSGISFRRRTPLQDVTDHDPEPSRKQEPEPEQSNDSGEEVSASEPEKCRLERLFPPSVDGYETFEMEESAEPSVSSF